MRITNKSALRKVYHHLRGKALALDCETTGLRWWSPDERLLGVSLADDENTWYVEVNEETELVLAWCLDKLLTKKKGGCPGVAMHHASFDMHWLRRIGVYPTIPIWDTQGLSHAYREGLPMGLKKLGYIYLDQTPLKLDKKWLRGEHPDELAEYAERDARVTYDLAHWFAEHIPAPRLRWFIENEQDLPRVAYVMEEQGIGLDLQLIKEHRRRLQAVAEVAALTMVGLVPGLENPNSTQQVAEALASLGMTWGPRERTPKGQVSTGSAILEKHLEMAEGALREFLEALLLYRKATKYAGFLDNKRGNGLLAFADDRGVLHPSWRVWGTVTGRWACTSPNVQQMPKKMTFGDVTINPRMWFRAPDGYRFLVCDLAQAEFRVMTAQCRDETLLKAFREGADVHTLTACRLFLVPPDQITPHQRFIGKTFNYANIYGAGPRRLAGVTGLTEDEIDEFSRRFRNLYPRLDTWVQLTRERAKQQGFVRTLAGRLRRPVLLSYDQRWMRPLEEYASGVERGMAAAMQEEVTKARMKPADLLEAKTQRERGQLISRGQRQAVNATIQGTVADCINAGLLKILRAGYSPCAQVHDEVIVVVPEDVAEQAADVVRKALTVDLPGGIKLTGELSICQRWGEGH